MQILKYMLFICCKSKIMFSLVMTEDTSIVWRNVRFLFIICSICFSTHICKKSKSNVVELGWKIVSFYSQCYAKSYPRLSEVSFELSTKCWNDFKRVIQPGHLFLGVFSLTDQPAIMSQCVDLVRLSNIFKSTYSERVSFSFDEFFPVCVFLCSLKTAQQVCVSLLLCYTCMLNIADTCQWRERAKQNGREGRVSWLRKKW